MTVSVNESYSKFIYVSRYSRWLYDQKRRENWDESVDRYMKFFSPRIPAKFRKNIAKEIREAVLNMEIMPSMRAFMTAGGALEKDNVAGYNPVLGSTRVVTREFGNVAIENIKGSATVLSKKGEWTSSSFKSYGRQTIYSILFKLNSNTEKIVECSGKHRWLLSSGIISSTDSLQQKDRVAFVSAPKPKIDNDYVLGVRHGIIYGDGTAVRTAKRIKGYHIRLCGDSRELLDWFSDYPVTYPPSANGDPVVMLYDGFAATHSLKELPLISETESYLLGFIRGWLAADGSVSKNSQVSLCVSGIGKDWLKEVSEKVGFTIQHIKKQPAETNYGKRNRASFVIYFSRSSMVEDDFLCSWKKNNFKELKSYYSVYTVTKTKRKESVYCAEVPDTNTFVLEGGLLTGNCSYVAVDDPRAFDEAMYISMCGTGVGFSVERQYIANLPTVAENFYPTNTVLQVRDSKIGWATAFKELIALLYSGMVPTWDISQVRPAGSPLKTFGGRSSGPDPLIDLFNFTISTFKKAAGRKLTSIECHDIMCKVGEIVVVGGVRRSAMISLSNLSDDRMRAAKTGQWWEEHPYRSMANNSAVYTEKPDLGIFMKEWQSLYESKSGERGIYNRQASVLKAKESGRRKWDKIEFGTNPCGEILLRSMGFCNLTEVVIRPNDRKKDLTRKVKLATILGTLQSTLTDFRYLRKGWQKNAEEERLLGVSLTGIMDNPLTSNPKESLLKSLKETAIRINKLWAARLNINQSVAITCVKPSGTVSQLVNSSSGIHPRHDRFYIRAVRNDRRDPITDLLKEAGVPNEPEAKKPNDVDVFYFPLSSPEKSANRADLTAIQQLEVYLKYRKFWCEHNPSCTVYIRESEWLEVASWVYRNFNEIGGVSFLPFSEHNYKQAPYTTVTEADYKKAVASFPTIDWNKLTKFENDDRTIGAQEPACVGGVCEI